MKKNQISILLMPALVAFIPISSWALTPSFMDIYTRGKNILDAQVKLAVNPDNIGKFIKMVGSKEQQIVEKDVAAYLIKHRGYRIFKPSSFGSALEGARGLPRLYPRIARQLQHKAFKISPYLLGMFLFEEKLRNAYSFSLKSILAAAAPVGVGGLAVWSYLAHHGFAQNGPLKTFTKWAKNSSVGQLHELYSLGKKAYVQDLINNVPLELQGSYVECNAAGIPIRVVKPSIGKYLLESRNYWQRSPSAWGSFIPKGTGLPRLYPPLSKTIRQAFLRGSAGTFLGLVALSGAEKIKKSMNNSDENADSDEWKTENAFL